MKINYLRSLGNQVVAKGLIILLLLAFGDKILPPPAQPIKGYWIWAGISADEATAPATPLYLYQGLVTPQGYERKGLFPHPLSGRYLYLALRLEGPLPEPEALARLFQSLIEPWQAHGAQIIGVQLDFDSPTAKLLSYSDFLKQFRTVLPARYRLSITGLGDWVVRGDLAALESMAQQSDEIIFQLYQDRDPLPDIGYFVESLAALPLPFKVGLLARPENDRLIATLSKNPYFGGVVLFIQR